jgi:hypothetical protein
MNILNNDILQDIIFFLNLNQGLTLIKTNKKLYHNKNTILSSLIKKETNFNNYEYLKKKIIVINKYNIFLDKLLYNNFQVFNNYFNLSNAILPSEFYNYYNLLINIKKIKKIKDKLLFKKQIYPFFNKCIYFIIKNYNQNHYIYFDIFKYKKNNNKLELYLNYNNTYRNYQRFFLLFLFLSFNKFI